MTGGKDIFGNDTGTDVFGNDGDKNAFGERPKNGQGNAHKDIWGNQTGSEQKEEAEA